MLKKLLEANKEAKRLLTKNHSWNSLWVNYHKPYVERLWVQWGEFRISLHKIYPCKKDEELFHPHPWPMASYILKGEYEMGVGYSQNSEIEPLLATRLIISDGSSYEITNPNCWHYVRPINDPSYSLMVTGKPWVNKPESKALKLKPINPERKVKLMSEFKKLII